MVTGFLVGCCIGFILLVIFKEWELDLLCRVCVAFWCSVVFALITGEFMAVGFMNLVAHVSYLILKEVAYDS